MLRLYAVLSGVAVLASWGCTAENSAGDPVACSVSQLLWQEYIAMSPAVPLRLAACPLTVDVRMGEPIRALVVLQNVSPRYVRVLNPELGHTLDALVESPDGQNLGSMYNPGYIIVVDTVHAGSLIPAGGFVGRVVRLDCVEVPDRQDCLPAIRFDQEGEYAISFAYFWPSDPYREPLRTNTFEIRVTQD